MQMKRRRGEIVAHGPEPASPSKAILAKQDSGCFNCGNYREGFLVDYIGILNALPVEPQVTIDFSEPAALSLASAEGPIGRCDSLSITNLLEFADPCRQFEFNVISTHAALFCWENVSRNLKITAELAGGHTTPAVSLRAASSFNVHPHVDGLRITISPAWWSHATSFTIVGLHLAGQLIYSPLLPAIVNVVTVNNAPSKAGRMWTSTEAGDFAGVILAIKDSCSTEESDDKVCIVIFMPNKFYWCWYAHIAFYRSFQGETPLHVAANAGRDDVVNVLIAAGADIDASIKV